MRTTNSTMNASRFKVPGNDGMGGGCLPGGRLPGFGSEWFPEKRNIIMGSLDDNGTYAPAAWSKCCERSEVSLVVGCYPWCEIPKETMGKDGDTNRISHDMRECIGEPQLTSVKLSSATAAGPSLVKVLAVGAALSYMFM